MGHSVEQGQSLNFFLFVY